MTVTSTDICAGLMKAYAPPSHRVFFEVSNDTGAQARRHIDAVAVGIWPSTGYEITGIEIKVSRGDWLRELKEPAKAQALMRFCTRWCLACPDGLVKPDELPATWGMLTLKDGTIKTKVKPPKLDPEPLTPGFMMAVLRNANSVDMGLVDRLVAARDAERRKSFDESVEREARYKSTQTSSRTEAAIAIAEKLERITGQDIQNWTFDAEALAAAYMLVKRGGFHSVHGYGANDLPGVIQALASAQATLKEIYEAPPLVEARQAIADAAPRRASA
ncbi:MULTISPECIES: hypothetical protein [unclassified Chelatococcus]|uniref:hypothetical protein n=1 Tax=unclassified Chelatococcus TaxID=2638111 RepID=UPI001BD1372B|nr:MULTISPECIES: hypothetical protein [unclassified Chelatococcus]CAH1670549.1 conserved hypothetical protein [Hyphomicrobiales bacterium]MBS7738352.1 hypothetical protein [Chelatococcus sp. HY11]MBX3545880.1 hypothetical protein [Chelatococcus sp.]MCO5077302.1 hypothetical protein [Chelatococcus sp.]CAH1677217.1 conserved hypothetical protein [Hyphomicrobiales bacterium]